MAQTLAKEFGAEWLANEGVYSKLTELHAMVEASVPPGRPSHLQASSSVILITGEVRGGCFRERAQQTTCRDGPSQTQRDFVSDGLGAELLRERDAGSAVAGRVPVSEGEGWGERVVEAAAARGHKCPDVKR